MTVDPTGRGIARPVVRIAEGGVSIGVALIILSLAIVQGFQRDVRELVVGFGAHLRVVAADQASLTSASAASDGSSNSFSVISCHVYSSKILILKLSTNQALDSSAVTL